MSTPADNGKVPVGAFRHAVYGDTLEDFEGRNTWRTDNTHSIDMGFYKTFKIVRSVSAMLRLDCFNILNTARWSYPGNDINAPASFDRVTQTAYIQTASPSSAPAPLSPPRTWQLGMRLIY